MNEYVKQAKDFLESCNATMKITQIGCEQNKNWNERVIDRKATFKVFKQIMEIHMQDFEYLFNNNIDEIITKAKEGRE